MDTGAFDQIQVTAAAVEEAPDIDAALGAVVECVRKRFPIGAGYVVVFVEGTGRVVAFYADHESIFEVGTEIPIDLTPHVLVRVGQLMRGMPLVVRASEPFGMLSDALLRERMEEMMLVPLRRGGAVLGLLGLAVPEEGKFGDVTGYASALGEAVEERVLDLVDASGRA